MGIYIIMKTRFMQEYDESDITHGDLTMKNTESRNKNGGTLEIINVLCG